jgi:hypothetical protein
MANVGTAAAGKTLIGAGATVSPTFADIGTDSGLTDHGVLISHNLGAFTSVTPSATSGIPLVSQGVAANPAYTTAVVAGGGTGGTTFTAYSVITAGTTSTGAFQNVSGTGTLGQVLTSNGAGALPTWNNPNNVFPWTDVTTATQTIAVANGYITDRGAGVNYTLPATAAIGDLFIIMGKLGLTTITPNANQQLLMGSTSGTVGVTGTAVGTNVGDSVNFRCITSGASTVWRAESWVGNWTLS